MWNDPGTRTWEVLLVLLVLFILFGHRLPRLFSTLFRGPW
jgi:Sec-independent protein translocase protein TatA